MDQALEGGARDFNVDVFYAGDSDASAIRDSLEMLPMMSPRRVVVVKNADSLKAKDLEELQPLVEKPLENSLLILISEKVDSRKKFFKAVDRVGALVKMDRVQDAQLPNWVQKIASDHGKGIAQDAVLLLIQMVGASLLEMNNEIQKLSQYIGSREKIEKSDVQSVVSQSRLESVFGLTNAIGERDRATALTFLAHLLDHGENEVGVLSLISRHMRLLILVREAMAEGTSRSNLPGRVGIPPFFAQDYISQAQRWLPEQLRETFEACLETDRALKSSPVSSHIWLENFIIKACP